ncbi:MAG: universal stress protein [Nitrospirae bacterium]|nr:universal stress protein [Nitrospirota bacterium]
MSEVQSCPMAKVGNILLFTDGTEFSEGAIRTALKLASRCSSTLFVMGFVFENTDGETYLPREVDKMADGVSQYISYVKERAAALNLDCQIILSYGDTPQQSIVEHVQKNQIDLLVIGRRGYKGLLKFLAGEVAADIIGRVTCKVLVVPRGATLEGKTVLVGIDGSKHSESAAKEAVEVAKRLKGNLIVLFSIHSEDERKYARYHVDMTAKMSTEGGVDAETLVPTGRSYKMMLEVADEKGVDMIVVGSYGVSGFKKLLKGSATEKLIEQAKCPVLVVNAGE